MKKTIFIIIVAAVLVFLCFIGYQRYMTKITGTVSDENQLPLDGATVKINGKSTKTDNNGKFILRVRRANELDIDILLPRVYEVPEDIDKILQEHSSLHIKSRLTG